MQGYEGYPVQFATARVLLFWSAADAFAVSPIWVCVCLGAVLQQAEALGFISELSQTSGNAEQGLGIRSVRNSRVLIESGYGLVVLLREVRFDEVSAGEFIGMVEGEGPPEPRPSLGAQSLLHVAKTTVPIENAFFHIVANGGVCDDPRGWRKAGRIDGLEIQFGKTGDRGSWRNYRNGQDVIPLIPVEGKLFSAYQRAARIELLERG